jgi:catechol 2,3-dioxygenase-like lactoylglutathione lyase family enzyme
MVDDVATAVDFYTGRLGFTLEERWGPAFAIVAKGDLDLWLSGPQTSAARAMPDGRVPAPGGWNRIVITVDDIHGMAAGLRDAGVRFRGEIITGPGGSQLLIEDPSGNGIEIFQPAG